MFPPKPNAERNHHDDDRARLLEPEHLLVLHVHERSVRSVHEQVPGIAGCAPIIHEQSSSDEEAGGEQGFKSLGQLIESAEVPGTYDDADTDRYHEEAGTFESFVPFRRDAAITLRTQETEHHGRESRRLDCKRDEVALVVEDDEPRRQPYEVHLPRTDAELLVTARVDFGAEEKAFVEEEQRPTPPRDKRNEIGHAVLPVRFISIAPYTSTRLSQAVNLRRDDKIILRKPLDGVGRERDADLAP